MLKFLKYLVLAISAIGLTACSSDDETDSVVPPAPGEGLTLSLSKQVIQSNGQDCSEFIVKYDGLVVNSGVTIFDENDKPVTDTKQFKTTQEGVYKFWASYKSHHTESVTLKAISIPVPVLPADPQPENTEFKKKVLLTQFTGTGCGFCPFMTNMLREVLSEKEYAEKAILTVAHTFNRTDPGYLTDDRLAQAFGISDYPSLNVDFMASFSYSKNFSAETIRSMIKQAYKYPAEAGVMAKSEIIKGKDGENKIAVHVAVKAASEGEYSVGAWLMEDSIKANQANYGPEGDFDFTTHNNVLRVVDSKAGFNNYSGIELGKIAKGKTSEHVFIMSLKDKWKLEKCHMIVFVSKKVDNKIFVTNVTRCPVEGDLLYDYTK